MLSSFTTDIAFSIPNRYNIPLVVNHPPVVKAGPDQTVEENGTVVLHGIANDSDPGDIISYSWRQMAGHAVKLSSSNSKNPSFIAPKVSVDTQLRFALTARDDRGATSITPANVTITVKHINRALVANAGTDQTVNAGDKVILYGSGSKDPDGTIISYSWKQSSGPSVALNSSDRGGKTFSAPPVLSVTTLAFSLTVTDDKGASSTPENVAITVTSKHQNLCVNMFLVLDILLI